MKKINGSVHSTDEQGNDIEDYIFTYDEEERQQRVIDQETAKLVYSPKFIPYDVAIEKEHSLTKIETLLYGFIDFYLSNSDQGRFYFTNDQLGKVLNCNSDTISRSLSTLKAKGIVSVQSKMKTGGGQIRFIQLGKNYKPVSAKTTSRTRQKLQTKENKIKDNKINNNKYIEQYVPTAKAVVTTTFDESSYPFRISKYLLGKIESAQGKLNKQPDLQKWAKHIDLLLRVDKRTPQEVAVVIEWLYSESKQALFWRTNTLSTDSLRRNWDRLIAVMVVEHEQKKTEGQTWASI